MAIKTLKYVSGTCCTVFLSRAVVVAHQLVEGSLPSPEVRGSNLSISKNFTY